MKHFVDQLKILARLHLESHAEDYEACVILKEDHLPKLPAIENVQEVADISTGGGTFTLLSTRQGLVVSSESWCMFFSISNSKNLEEICEWVGRVKIEDLYKIALPKIDKKKLYNAHIAQSDLKKLLVSFQKISRGHSGSEARERVSRILHKWRELDFSSQEYLYMDLLRFGLYVDTIDELNLGIEWPDALILARKACRAYVDIKRKQEEDRQRVAKDLKEFARMHGYKIIRSKYDDFLLAVFKDGEKEHSALIDEYSWSLVVGRYEYEENKHFFDMFASEYGLFKTVYDEVPDLQKKCMTCKGNKEVIFQSGWKWTNYSMGRGMGDCDPSYMMHTCPDCDGKGVWETL